MLETTKSVRTAADPSAARFGRFKPAADLLADNLKKFWRAIRFAGNCTWTFFESCPHRNTSAPYYCKQHCFDCAAVRNVHPWRRRFYGPWHREVR